MFTRFDVRAIESVQTVQCPVQDTECVKKDLNII